MATTLEDPRPEGAAVERGRNGPVEVVAHRRRLGLGAFLMRPPTIAYFGFLMGLLALLGLTQWGLYLHYVGGTESVRLGGALLGVATQVAVPLDMNVWAQVALMGAIGMTVNRGFVVAYHGFVRRGFEGTTHWYHTFSILRAALLTCLLFAIGGTLGAVILPAGLPLPSGPLTASAPVLWTAFLFGTFSEDLDKVLHRGFRRLLGNDPGPQTGALPDLPGADLPLDLLLGREDLAHALGLHPRELDRGLERLAKQHVRYVHDLLPLRDAPPRLKAIAKASDLDPDVLVRLVELADVSRVTADFDLATKALGHGWRTAEDAARGIANATAAPVTGTGDGATSAAAALPFEPTETAKRLSIQLRGGVAGKR